MNILELPFNQHLGLTLTQHGDQEVVCLEPQEQHRNHLGTVHAGALFSLAEAGSGHALLNQLGLDSGGAMAVLRSAEVKYRRPAANRLIAQAAIDQDAIDNFRRQYAARGRAFIEVHIRVVNSQLQEVFVGDFSWFISRVEEP